MTRQLTATPFNFCNATSPSHSVSFLPGRQHIYEAHADFQIFFHTLVPVQNLRLLSQGLLHPPGSLAIPLSCHAGSPCKLPARNLVSSARKSIRGSRLQQGLGIHTDPRTPLSADHDLLIHRAAAWLLLLLIQVVNGCSMEVSS